MSTSAMNGKVCGHIIIMQRQMSGEGLSDGYASGENEQKDCWRIMQPEGLSAKDCQRIMQPQMSGRNVGI